jgi:hypothetical protein
MSCSGTDMPSNVAILNGGGIGDGYAPAQFRRR